MRALSACSRDRPFSPRWGAAILLLALAATYFALRGPARADLAGSADFALIHASTSAWVKGENPYDAEAVGRTWREAGGSDEINPAKRGDKDLLYPPSAFLILSPLALTGARAGLVVWTVVSIACALFAAAVAARLAGLHFRGKQGALGGRGGWLVIAAMLALAPGHTNFNVGQTAHIVLGAIALAYAARLWKPDLTGDILCGVCLGVASALKPQLGLPFLAFELLFARWATLLAGGAAGALLLGMGGARLWLVDIDWITAWRANIAAFKTSGAGNPTADNPWRYQIVSLHYPLHAFIGSVRVVNAIVLLICGGLGIWFWTLRRRAGAAWPSPQARSAPAEARGPHLLDISMAAALSLLFFYHRFYDAVALIFPAALAIALLARGGSRRLPPLALLLLLAVFLVPGAATLRAADEAWNLVPDWLSDTLLFQGVIMPHQPWTILLIAGVLVWLAASRPGKPPDAAHSPSDRARNRRCP